MKKELIRMLIATITAIIILIAFVAFAISWHTIKVLITQENLQYYCQGYVGGNK